jgi:hypothetical protein
VTTVEQKEVQERLHAMIRTLNPDARPTLEHISDGKLLADLDCLDLMIKYFIFDREASIREAIEFGKGDEDVK